MPDAPSEAVGLGALMGSGVFPARARGATSASVAVPVTESDLLWEALEPHGTYAELVRPLLTGLLVALAVPVTLALALPVALVNLIALGDPRLVLFRQKRVGHRGRVFTILKFRTMRPVGGSNFDSWESGDTNRVTALGRFLRSTHLDELPQIFNVLRGEMDLIGPRPEMVEVHEWARAAVPGFERRLAVRPGITGLAQITQGYCSKDPGQYRAKLALDERYRERLSFGLDLAILVRTVLWMVAGRGWTWRRGAPGR